MNLRFQIRYPAIFKYLTCMVLMAIVYHANAQQAAIYNANKYPPAGQDWLVSPINIKAQVLKSADGKDLTLYNGLVKRVFRLSPDLACTDYQDLSNNRQLLRAVREEARLTINGKTYNVGGLYGQTEQAYLSPAWIDGLTAGKDNFKYVSYSVAPIAPFLKWDSSKFWAQHKSGGTGIRVSFLFEPTSAELKGLQVKVSYELYDGMPLMMKSITLLNNRKGTFLIDRVVNEVLAMVEEESAVEGSTTSMRKPSGVYFETNYAFNNSMTYANSDQTTHWKADSSYVTQVNYNYQSPCLLEIYPDKGPGVQLRPGEVFNSVRTHELLVDGNDHERRGLAIRRMYRAVAPWTTANPLFMHLVSKNDKEVRTAIDQCAATGYEAVILSFGSHLHVEDTTAANLQRWKQLADYAHNKQIRIGCYSLFSSRSISPEDDVIDPVSGLPNKNAMFGHAPCLGSKWGLWYLGNIKHFFTLTGFDMFENDGPYPGDVCASTTHPGHHGLADSQWQQINLQKELYHWMSARGIYVNCPDWYLLDGSNKIALGYRETNFSLPREQQKVLNRQNIFDGTWEKPSSMNWGFVPLTAYQGGGEEAVLEPLADHLKDYEQLMMQYYGAGIQACYRGPRLYDADTTRKLVVKVINWYKRYRQILNSDIIHLRRADGRDWDGILHVNAAAGASEQGLLMLYNPLKEPITRTIKVPLYYTGATDLVRIAEKEGAPTSYHLNRDHSVDLKCTLAPESYTWFVIKK